MPRVADVTRPEIRARQRCRDRGPAAGAGSQRSRPRVEAFGGYEAYSERDPAVGPEFNHGCRRTERHLAHLRWIRDAGPAAGHARPARRGAPRFGSGQTFRCLRRRSAFLDLQQADRVLQSETRNVQNADESLEIAKGNLGAGLGTQLDILQAASDVTRTRRREWARFIFTTSRWRSSPGTGANPVRSGPRRSPRIRQARRRSPRGAAPPSTLGGGR